jgi:hypothetical protein
MKTMGGNTIRTATAPAHEHEVSRPFIVVTPGFGPIPPVPVTTTAVSSGGLRRALAHVVTRAQP